jgi:hypothetical protein
MKDTTAVAAITGADVHRVCPLDNVAHVVVLA